MVYWTLGIAVSLIGLWAGYTHLTEGSLGQPSYQVIAQFDGIELRKYEPFILATTQPEQTGDPGLRQGFRVLAGYIFGGNQPAERMQMTAPVLQQDRRSARPGSNAQKDIPNMHMSFVMPTDRTLKDLPQPHSADVSLSEVSWGEVAAIRFSGPGRQARFARAEKRLREALTNANRAPRAPSFYAQYNSPAAFPPLRRNEVLIPIQSQ